MSWSMLDQLDEVSVVVLAHWVSPSLLQPQYEHKHGSHGINDDNLLASWIKMLWNQGGHAYPIYVIVSTLKHMAMEWLLIKPCQSCTSWILASPRPPSVKVYSLLWIWVCCKQSAELELVRGAAVGWITAPTHTLVILGVSSPLGHNWTLERIEY